LKFFFKFGAHSLNCHLFCFKSFSWLIYFFYISTPRHLFSFKLCVKFGSSSFNCYFFNYFLNELVFYNFIPKYLISFDFMLNLVLILLITIFLLMFFSISSPDICLVKYLVFFFCLWRGHIDLVTQVINLKD
jgi:hypothetical protein